MRAGLLSKGGAARWELLPIPAVLCPHNQGTIGLIQSFLTGLAPPSPGLQGSGAKGRAARERSCASSWLAPDGSSSAARWDRVVLGALQSPRPSPAVHIWDRLEGPRELICSLLTAKAVSQNYIKPTSSFSSKLSLETTCPWASTGTCSLSPGTSLEGLVLRRLKRETCYSQGGSWRFFCTKLHMGIAALGHGREFAGDSFLIPVSCVAAAPISIRGWLEQPLRPGDSSAQARWKCLYK